jgi:hypothetical protein
MRVDSSVWTSRPRKPLNHYLPGPKDGGLGAGVQALSLPSPCHVAPNVQGWPCQPCHVLP